MPDQSNHIVPPTWKWQWTLCLAVFLASGFLVFWNLGHYALWDDEASTALFGVGVWRTGDTTAVIGHNIVAYDSGKDLSGLHERFMPPLPAYLVAPFVGILGQSAFAARIPFAIMGWVCIGWMLWWAMKAQGNASSIELNNPAHDRPSTSLIIFAIAILGNVSLFLFSRQCRYHAPVLLSSVAIAFFYINRKRERWRLAAMALFSVILLASNYLQFAALYACLLVDYVIWQRNVPPERDNDSTIETQGVHIDLPQQSGTRKSALVSRRLLQNASILFLPQIIVGCIILSIWNPFATRTTGPFEPSSVSDKLNLVWLFLRDANLCEFGIIGLLLVGPALYFLNKNIWLIRIPAAILTYTLVIAFLCPIQSARYAEVRYMVPTIPLWITLGTLVLHTVLNALFAKSRSRLLNVFAASAAAILLFWTNLASLNWAIPTPPFTVSLRSSPILYVRELLAEYPDPYTLTARWLKRNVTPLQTVWTLPSYAAYPLMFQVPEAVYGWQLTYPPAPQFQKLPPIYFMGQQPPDYIVAFAEDRLPALDAIRQMRDVGWNYYQVQRLDFYGRDLYRPELYLRTFSPVAFDPETQAIYIYKHK